MNERYPRPKFHPLLLAAAVASAVFSTACGATDDQTEPQVQPETQQERTTSSAPLASSGTVLGRFVRWCGKVNSHQSSGGNWTWDSDCTSGCNVGGLSYCQKFWPGSTSIRQVAVSSKPNNVWANAGCAAIIEDYDGSDEFECVADSPSEPPYEEVVLDRGNSWQLMRVSGQAADDNGQSYTGDLFVLQNATGIYSVPLTAGLQDDLDDDVYGDDTVIIVQKQIADEIAIAEQQGYLTPYLQSIAEPGEGVEQRGGRYTGDETGLFGKCSNRAIDKTKSFNLNQPFSQTENLGSGFSGTLSVSGNIQGSVTGEAHLHLKRYAVFGVCIPYAVRFNNARAYGNLQVAKGATVNGSLQYSRNWEFALAKPKLFSIDFMAGPIPVHIGFNLPLTLGLNLQASVTGTVQYNSDQSSSGSFDYTCTLDGCSGGATYLLASSQPGELVTGSVSGRVQPTIWLQAALRAYLYNEWIAYAQVGVRPHLYADLWGYYGNNCGDADYDGVPDTVSALTLDLDWQLYITAEAAAFGGNPKKWNDLWHTNRNHIRFWNLTSSNSAFQPLLEGSAVVLPNSATAYNARMRSCWPYGDSVNYQFNWGDSTTNTVSGAPQSPASASHAWSSTGPKTVTLTALQDSHGRSFNTATARTIQVNNTPPPPPGGAHWFDYSASNTSSATQNTVNRGIVLTGGQTLTVGTCNVSGSSGTGDNYLRINGPSGAMVAANDDGGGNCNLQSYITYTVPQGAGGTYTLMAGCYSSGSCSGRVAWTIGGTFYYSASNTSSASVSTADYNLTLSEGEILQVGTCNVAGSSGSGDTYLRLNNGAGTQVTYNDDNCGYLSYMSYTVPSGGAGVYRIRAGCYSSTSCNGTVSYLITGQ